MDTLNKNNIEIRKEKLDNLSHAKFAEVLTGLQLNNIKLDIKHSLLTPEYLENF